MKYAEVAVDAPAGHERTFSYSVPDGMALVPGQLVRVPFGSRRLQGVVFSLGDEPNFPHTRDILSAVAAEPHLGPVQLELARWVSDRYMCSLFEATAPMLPPGARTGGSMTVDLIPSLQGSKGQSTSENLSEAQARVMDYLRKHAPVARGRLLKAMGETAERTLRALERKGLIILTPSRESASIGPKLVKYLALTPLGASALTPQGESEDGSALSRAPKQAELASVLASSDEAMALADANRTYGVSAVNGLRRRGWVTVVEAALSRDPLFGLNIEPVEPVSLTGAQAEAAAEVGRALLGDGTGSFLLEGVTGSGKTEVYLDAVEAAIAGGKRAIVMVPEIALTHQTIERMAERFPGNVAVQHSGLTPGERYDQWWKIRRGEYGVVVGSRSAIFAPQPDLGLVVIDEEHEWTYKQNEPDPRYHAREVAIRLAQLVNAAVLMGSASPDVETYFNAESKLHQPLHLSERIATSEEGVPAPRPLASVEVIDMRSELKEGHRHFLSRDLIASLKDVAKSGGKSILFLNRRGASSQLMCRNCGHGVRCRRCDVPLTLHNELPGSQQAQTQSGQSGPTGKDGILVCHYCGNRRRVPPVCPTCKQYQLSLYGIGTQAVEAAVSDLLPGVTVLRWDRDTAKKASDVEHMMAEFRQPGPAVLVGTQVVAKGLHFPDVTLVGVILADLSLGVPDFRSGERTFQLITQVAGRAGRGAKPGRVIVQTYMPENYAIRAAATQNYRAFYEEELEYRREMGNPPFSRLIRLGYSHTNKAAAEREALRYADLLRHERDVRGLAGLHVMGPTPGFPPRLRGRFRWRVTLRGQDPRWLLDRVPVPQKWTVDVDPIGT
jgi:primosomal protein N' (replication factor Y) (superfamily II helicase)